MPALLLWPTAMFAQLTLPIGIVRGDVVLWTGSVRGGELKIRGAENTIYSCRFDARTYFEREDMMTTVTSIEPGDPVEVVADGRPESSCYALTVQVVDPRSRFPSARRFRSVLIDSPTESFAPHGDVLFGGLVVKIDTARLTVRTRNGEMGVTLLPDTRYLDGGRRVESPALLNKHVFVRAGRDVWGDLEAYRVMWGEIVAPE
jgi:hypothetical protein